MSDAVSFCFLDVDGVVADLCGALALRHEKPVATWPPGDYELSRILGKTHPELWNDLGHAFWGTLLLTPWARELVALADAAVGSDHVAFLTQPVRDPGCSSGKHAWFARHFPGRAWFVGPAKRLLARPGALLVDDSDANVAEWRERGGEAVLLPARWNALHEDEDDPLSVVRAEFERLGLAT